MSFIKRLQDPQLVVHFQTYFGVLKFNNTKTNKYIDPSPIDDDCQVKTSSQYDSYSTKYLGDNIAATNPYTKADPYKCHSRSQSNVSEASTGSGSRWHHLLADDMVGGTENSMDDDTAMSDGDQHTTTYRITNWFWYTMFTFATMAGDEVFYTIFFPFWAWNVDGAVLRRVMVIWMITMYIGQVLKDILKIPRPPSPPVIRLDKKWVLEYGLPSTHAMVGMSMPFSLLILSLQRYQLDYRWGLVLAVMWCSVVCGSRLYLGMHSVLDIICGLLLVSLLMAVLLPCIDTLDQLALTHPASPIITLILTLAMVVCYPATDRWTPARGDTTVIVGVGCGCLVGSWINYQLGIIREPSLPPPYTVIWPTFNMVGLSLLRTTLGLVIIMAVRAIFKTLSFATICALLQVNTDDYHCKSRRVPQRDRLIVELFYKFITYITIGVTIVYTAPMAFRYIGIERPTFYTEM